MRPLLCLLLCVPALGHGPWTEKIQAVSAELEVAPDSVELWLRRADYFRADGNRRLAAADLARAAALEPTHRDVIFLRAELAFADGHADSARVLLQGRASNAWEHRLLAAACLAVADTAGAIAAWRADPLPLPEHRVALGRLLEARGQGEAALALLEEAFAADEAVILRIAIVDTLARAGRLDEGLALVVEAREAARIKVFWKLVEARACYEAGAWERGRQAAARALAEIEEHKASGRMRPSAYLRGIEAEALALGGAWARAVTVLAPGEQLEERARWLVHLGAVRSARRLERLQAQRGRAERLFAERARSLHEIRMRALILGEEE